MFDRMNPIDDTLFDEFRRVEREMDRMMGPTTKPGGIRDAARGSYPPVNIGATAEQVDIYLFAAGLNPDAVEITIHQQLLSVAGERPLITEQGATYYRQERFDGTFQRAITLPGDVDPDRVDASYRDGVLHITIRRSEPSGPRQIEIH
ncbi:MAG: heat-shock protein Hsp20 [Candidatus Sedimenticola endophacoides]|uniref:Heat-shock protein Hsp20 n=1 Tax=Candidatus Sedimenticola endophacoides TaxID=2548426 RepID=A0A6N4DE47_9GAMM|nr:MAG: heat-shock protein Hsp20 [Candidatus Sedimenticola endophacoides]OQX38102.1 MAG: heat-shock protein Hsp20 [Candidatus Sedimenticola endophacoides]OQX38836.1 MAG: heat-shock protein Hsp20 [Candidatus Sedimenticola endophacoides]OQX45539.1 MAG: heat-shock protein Hsp20 [Candidatus Sedimenticola endophacoides]PUD98009.1 MAG: heat-shock protein Hsp20 [Candidatus Sedimenticola endophacoides]